MSDSPTQAKTHIIHAHTTMSVLDGASSIKDYVKYAIENGLGSCACSEHGYLLGDYDLTSECDKAKIKAIHGIEYYLLPRPDHKFANPEKPYRYFHLTVWAMNEIGHKNLISLSTRSWGPDRVVTIWGHHRPCITWEDLLVYNEGLIVGSGCIEGPIGKPLLMGEDTEAYLNAVILWEIFKGRMFFEIMPNSVDCNYIKGDVIQVEAENGKILSFMPTDILVTDQGEMTAEEACKRRVGEILSFKTPRMQKIPLYDTPPEVNYSSGELITPDVEDRAILPVQELVEIPLP